MSLISLIGNISLNISFVFYLVLYTPQIIHNREKTNLAQLSLNMHFLLCISYTCDLFYGVATHLPWQYKVVSLVGLTLVFIQHCQLARLLFNIKSHLTRPIMVMSLLLFLMANYYFFIVCKGTVSESNSLVYGWIARCTGILYCFPQILKNRQQQSATAISIKFIVINLLLSILDFISSWCLNFGWPNKISSPITMILMIILLLQIKRYRTPRCAYDAPSYQGST